MSVHRTAHTLDPAPRRTRSRWYHFHGVLRPVGSVLAGLGLAQLLCAAIGGALEWIHGSAAWDEVGALGLGGAIGIGAGAGCALYARRAPAAHLSRRVAILSVGLIWAASSVLAAIPFVVSAGLSPSDALFETTSGFTTTGATVITHIERDLARPLLLWRSLIQWLGGMGIVVLMVAVFPTLGAGAKHMYRGEVPGTSSEGLKPRIAATSFTLWKLYAALTALMAILLVVCGLSPFDAVCHAFTTLSTGGFSTLDASVGGFENPAVEYVVAVFMLVGSLNFGLYYVALKERSLRALVRSTELVTFVVLVGISVVIGTAALYTIHDRQLEVALRKSLFQVATFVSSTGSISDDYMAYPSGFLVILIVLMFIGGCSGSTAGGLKVERAVLMAKVAWAETLKAFRPAHVRAVRMGHAAVSPEILTNVAAFFAVYVGILFGGVLAITALESVPFDTAFGAVLTCLANSGPAPFYLDGDNFAGYSAISKLLFVLIMLLGRLEMFTLLALLSPAFWRK